MPDGMTPEFQSIPFDPLSPGRGRGGFDVENNINYAFPDKDGVEPTQQELLAEANQRLLEADRTIDNLMSDRNSPIGKTFQFIEKGGIPESLKNPERKEELEETHEEMMRSLYDPVITFSRDARTHFVPQGWPIQHEWSSIKRMEGQVRIKASIHRPYKPEKIKDPKFETLAPENRPSSVEKPLKDSYREITRSAKEKKQLEMKEHIQDVYSSVVSAEMKTLGAFTTIIEHGFGPMSVYYSGKDMLGLNPRRITVMSTEDLRLAFNKKKDKKLNAFLSAQKDEAGSDPKNKIEDAPRFFEEGIGEIIKRYTAEMVDLNNVIAEMNKRNPFDPDGKEMRMSITPTEQEFVASLFKRIERKNEKGEGEWTNEKGEKKVDIDEQSMKIRIYFDKDNNQILVNGEGVPINKESVCTHKDVYVHTLAYENVVRSEADHKRYVSLMMAYTITGARQRLQEICKKRPDILSVSDEHDPDVIAFKQLVIEVDQVAKDLLDDWDSPRVSLEREAATYAVELNSMIQIGSLNIANLGHINLWRKEETEKDSKKYLYKYIDVVGDPDMALDAVSAMHTLAHEWTYAAVKNRIATPLLPPVHAKHAERLINLVASGGRDPELLAYAERSEHIARGYGLLGMFEEQLKNNPAWQEGERRRKELGLKCNDEVIQIYEQNMFGVPTVFEGEVFPMPLIPFFRSQCLFDSMHVSKTKTVQDLLLQDRQLLTEIDFEQYHPFAADGTAVVGKFTTDMTSIMYGAADPKVVDAVFGNPTEAIRRIIKEGDIGARAEVKLFKYSYEERNSETGKKSIVTETRPINKKFYEISYASYLIIAYLAFYKYGLWDGKEKFSRNLEALREGDYGKGIKGIKDYVEAASYLLDEKQGFGDYNDSFILTLLALTEFVKGIGVKADSGYAPTEELRKKVGDQIMKK